MQWSHIGTIFLVLLLIGLLAVHLNDKANYDKANYNKTRLDPSIIHTLTRQTARWAIASQQDKSPFIALLHANYAAGYLWALKDIASTEDIKNVTGINMLDLEKRIIKIQDDASQRAIQVCPGFSGEETDTYLAKIAKE